MYVVMGGPRDRASTPPIDVMSRREEAEEEEEKDEENAVKHIRT
jgi:hypothetical protein